VSTDNLTNGTLGAAAFDVVAGTTYIDVVRWSPGFVEILDHFEVDIPLTLEDDDEISIEEYEFVQRDMWAALADRGWRQTAAPIEHAPPGFPNASSGELGAAVFLRVYP